MTPLLNREGFVKSVLCLGVIFLLAYSGLQFGMPFYRQAAFRSEAKDIALLDLDNVRQVKSYIYEAAVKYRIPLEEKDIIIERQGMNLYIKASWTEQVNIFDLYQKALDFNINITGFVKATDNAID